QRGHGQRHQSATSRRFRAHGEFTHRQRHAQLVDERIGTRCRLFDARDSPRRGRSAAVFSRHAPFLADLGALAGLEDRGTFVNTSHAFGFIRGIEMVAQLLTYRWSMCAVLMVGAAVGAWATDVQQVDAKDAGLPNNWLAFGFAAQAMFTARLLVQWYASEKA